MLMAKETLSRPLVTVKGNTMWMAKETCGLAALQTSVASHRGHQVCLRLLCSLDPSLFLRTTHLMAGALQFGRGMPPRAY